jgi:hypothetical protein
MTAQVQAILQSFDQLADDDKRELMIQLVRRSLSLDAPLLSDEQLVEAADQVFLQFDQNEADNV